MSEKKTLTGKAKTAGVMGWPVAHSLSPRLHNYWLEKYGIDGAYIPMPVRPEKLEQALRALSALGLKGCNLTLPHKENALKAVDELTPRAKRAGAVNTVIVKGDGELTGDNTDGHGFLAHFQACQPDWQKGPVLLLGAGGATRAIGAALLDDTQVPELRIANRTLWRAEKLAGDLGGRITCYPWEERHKALEDVRLLVNTTYLGQAGQQLLDLDLERLPKSASIYDIVYVPGKTALLKEGEKRGNIVLSGLGMLIYQARPGFAAWFGREPEIEPGLEAFLLGGK